MRPVAVLRGLPLVAMPPEVVDELLRDTGDLLAEGGVFRTFSVLLRAHHGQPRRRLRERMRRCFPHFRVRGPICRNLPPAFHVRREALTRRVTLVIAERSGLGPCARSADQPRCRREVVSMALWHGSTC
jgi:hypothetical protein